MIIDQRTTFASAQVMTTSGISDVVDAGGDPNFLNGQGLMLQIQVTEAATAGGAASVAFSLESDSTDNLATAPTVLVQTPNIDIADLTAGAIVWRMPLPICDVKRYLGIRHTVTGGPLTTGAYRAALTPVTAKWQALPDAL